MVKITKTADRDKKMPLLRPGDGLAFSPKGLAKKICEDLMGGAETWHWGIIVRVFEGEAECVSDRYAISECLGSQVTSDLLSRYNNVPIRIYRPTLPDDTDFSLLSQRIHQSVCKHSQFVKNLRHRKSPFKSRLGGNTRFDCQEYFVTIWKDIGIDVLTDVEPLACTGLEQSSAMSLIYREF